MSDCTVEASRWEHGWELRILDAAGEEVGVTQSSTLDDAEWMVRDWFRGLELEVPASVDVQVT